jgi:hypothetical protein
VNNPAVLTKIYLLDFPFKHSPYYCNNSSITIASSRELSPSPPSSSDDFFDNTVFAFLRVQKVREITEPCFCGQLSRHARSLCTHLSYKYHGE